MLKELVTRDSWASSARWRPSGSEAESALLVRTPQLRGGPEVLDAAGGPVSTAAEGLRRVHELLAPEVASRLIFDLGLARNLGYYTGAVFDVYDAALGAPLGGGGRYDDLLGASGARFPRSASRSTSSACTWRSREEAL